MIDWIKMSDKTPPLGEDLLVWSDSLAVRPDIAMYTNKYGFLSKRSERLRFVSHYAYIDPPAKE